MPEITYRDAGPDDVEAITAIARRIWTMGMAKRLEDHFGPRGGKNWDEWTAQDIGGAVRRALPNCLVAALASERQAEAQGQVVGWVTWSINQERDQGQIGYNGVAPEFRGHGIGSHLVEMALERVRASGVSLALVITGLDEGHAAARRVYEKCGFQPFHQSVTYVMEL